MARGADPVTSLTRFFWPAYWGGWLVLALMWGLAQMPFGLQTAVGRGIGRLMYRFASRRRHIAAVNIGLCFPEMDKTAQQRMLRRHFDYLGMGMVEVGSAWWSPPGLFDGRTRTVGREHLDAALESGRGVILLSAHFCCLEVVGRLLARELDFAIMYRDQKNPLLNEIGRRCRQRIYAGSISRDEPRQMLRSLKREMPVWFAPDQNYGKKHSIFVPFFGVQASTIVATARMAKMANALVVPIFYRRVEGDQAYEIEFLPALDAFPGVDVEADTTRVNSMIESAIRKFPEQYFWVHRRFKTRPDGVSGVYDDGPS